MTATTLKQAAILVLGWFLYTTSLLLIQQQSTLQRLQLQWPYNRPYR